MNRAKNLTSSLRFRFLLLVLFAVVPALGLMLYAAAASRRHEAAGAKADALRLTRHAAEINRRLVSEARNLLFYLAHLPGARSGDQTECHAMFFGHWAQSTHYDNLGVLGPDGKVLCSGRTIPDPARPALRRSFERAIESRAFAIGEFEISPTTGKAVLDFAHPVLDTAGRVRTVVFATLDLDWLGELAAESELPEGTTVTVIDGSGLIVAHEPDSRRWVGRSALEAPVFRDILTRQREGTAEGISVNGIPSLFGFKPLSFQSKAGSAYVVVGIPRAVAFAEARRILVHSLAGLGLAAAVAVIAAWAGADLILLRRLKALLNVASQLTAGDLSARSGLQDAPGELGQLARAFDQMAAALQTRQVERERAEATLHEMNLALANAMPGISRLDPDGRYVDVNLAYASMLGYAPDELAGTPWMLTVHSDDHVNALAAYELLSREGSTEFEARAVRKDGSLFHKQVLMVKRLDKEGNPIGHYCFMRDITRRKEAEEALRIARDELEVRVQERTSELVEATEELQAELVQRRRTEDLLRDHRAQLAGVIDSAMDAVITMDADQRIILFNAAAEQVFHCTAAEVMGASIERFIPEEFRSAHHDHVRAFGRSGVTSRRLGALGVVTGLRADGERFPAEVAISQVEVGGRKLYTAILRDITERERTERALLESEERIRLLLDSTAEAIYGLDLHGNCTFCNPACLRLLGYDDAGALLGRNMHALIHSARADGMPYAEEECQIFRAFRQGEGTHVDDEVLWRADGSSFPAEYWSYPLYRGAEVVGAVVTFVDVTERKRAEAELRSSRKQLRALTGHDNAVREEERSRIAREIHDDLGQVLTGLKIDVSRLAARPGDQMSLEEKARAMGKVIDDAIRSVRRISMDLRPSVLDDLGLGAAIEWQGQDFQTRTGIVCQVALREGDLHLDREQSTAMFRVFRETLTNVARHANATRVDVTLETEGDRLVLTVRDNGRGVTESEIAANRSLGLLGMRERALLLGGETTIVGAPGHGTTVTMRIPLHRPSSDDQPRESQRRVDPKRKARPGSGAIRKP